MQTFAATLTDETLLERFRCDGDQRAFAVIVDRYAGAIFATSQRILQDRAQAEDVTQETFFKLLRSPGAVEQSLGGWLHRAATTLSIDVIRREGRRRGWEREHARRQDPPQPALIEATTWQDVSPHLDAALADLPDEQRWVLVQHYLRGRTMRDLAIEAGSSAPTMSRRHRAALEALRARLRRGGIVAGCSLLGVLLTEHATAAAAPPAVMHELTKMSLLHAAATSEGVMGPPRWLVGLAMLLAAGIVIAAALAAIVEVTPRHAVVDEPVAPPPVQLLAPTAAAAPPRYVVLPEPASDLDGRRLALVQHPATAPDRRLSVVFRDNRTATLSTAEVDHLVQRQTGATLADLATRQPTLSLDASIAPVQ